MQVCLQWNVSLKTRKTTVGWLQRASWKKDIKVSLLLQNCKIKSNRIIVVLKYEKCFFFVEKIGKHVQFNSLFLGIPKIFLSVRVRQVAFLSED